VTVRARILIVEDNPINRRLVHDLLVLRGHEVVEAASVEEARERLGEAPDLVLMDLQIPGGGGERMLDEIRADPSREHLPVIVVTAAAMRGDRERLLRAGFDAYVSKPIDIMTFGPMIEGFLPKGATP
jgi:two-component system cell cycle response regulator DivK